MYVFVTCMTGGPTAVEFLGELADFTQNEVAKLYPKLLGKVKLVLLNSGINILSAFDVILQNKALAALKREGVQIILQARVTSVQANYVTYNIETQGMEEEQTISFGMCVGCWHCAKRDHTDISQAYW